MSKPKDPKDMSVRGLQYAVGKALSGIELCARIGAWADMSDHRKVHDAAVSELARRAKANEPPATGDTRRKKG